MSGSTFGSNLSQTSLNSMWGGAGQLGTPQYNLAANNSRSNMSAYDQEIANLRSSAGSNIGSARYNLFLNQINQKYGQPQVSLMSGKVVTPAPIAKPVVTPAPIAKPVVTPAPIAMPVTGPVAPQPIQSPINMQGTIGMPAGPGFMQPPAVKSPIVAPIAPTPLPASQQFIAMPITTPVQNIVPSGVKVSKDPGSILRLRAK
jgi:hypothetical protein